MLQVGRVLTAYKDERKGPTVVAVQSLMDFGTLTSGAPALADFPLVPIHLYDNDALYNVLDWQRVGAKVMLRHFLKSDTYLQMTVEQCRYFHVPVGNLPKDSTAFGADLLYARWVTLEFGANFSSPHSGTVPLPHTINTNLSGQT